MAKTVSKPTDGVSQDTTELDQKELDRARGGIAGVTDKGFGRSAGQSVTSPRDPASGMPTGARQS